MTQVVDNLGSECVVEDFDPNDVTPDFDYYEDDDVDGFEGTPDEILPPTPEAGDNYVGARLRLPCGDREAMGRVAKRARDNDGNPIGRANQNPILDTREYIVEFEDGTQAELAANVIAQSMYAQCDPEGNAYVLFDSIVDYKRDSTAMNKNDQVARKADGRTYMRRSTVGWKLCVQWKDGSTSWERLADLKETHPTEVAEYAVAQDIADAPTFN